MFETLAHLFIPRHTNNHRPRIVHPIGLFALASIAIVVNILIRTTPMLPLFSNVLGYSSSITASQVLDEINHQRANEGLSALAFNQTLSAAATAKATDMFNEQYWAHTSPKGATPWVFIKKMGYNYNIAGENLARDFGDTQNMVSAWMNSPTHKENILNGKYSETGIAVVDGKLQGVETTLVVQMFGAPASARATVETTDNTAAARVVPQVQAAEELVEQETTPEPNSVAVLSETVTPVFSPLQLSKALALAMLGLIIGVFAYDMIVAEHKKTVRKVGKNIAHIALFGVVGVAIIFFKGGLLS